MFTPARSPRLTSCAILAMSFLGCSVPQEVTVEYRDGRTSTHKSFLVRDSAIILAEGVIEVKDRYGSYEMPVNATVLPFSQVKALTLTFSDANPFYRTSAGFVGGLAGVVIGAWAGTQLGGSRQGLEGLGPGLLSGLIGAAVGGLVGSSSCRYIVDKLSVRTIRLDPATQSLRDSLIIGTEHRE